MRPCLVGSVLIAGGVLLAACSSGASSTTTTLPAPAEMSPTQLLTVAETNACQQDSVLYKSRSTSEAGPARGLVISGEAAQTYGVQAAVHTVGKDVFTVTTYLKDNVAYVRTSAIGLETYLGLPPSTATRYAGKWISIDDSDPNFLAASFGLTVSGVCKQFAIKPPLSFGPRGKDQAGAPEASVKGAFDGSEGTVGKVVVLVSLNDPPLPQTEQAVVTGGKEPPFVASANFSWNRPFLVTVPHSATPFSSIAPASSTTSTTSPSG